MAGASSLLPLIILLVVVAGGGYIGYQFYLWSGEMKDRAGKSMEKRNMSFTKDGGLKVGVKQMNDESYLDKTQNVLVNVWNNADLPKYKSRLGWNSTQTDPKKKSSSSASNGTSRPSTGRANSSSTSMSNGRPTGTTSSASSKLSPPEPKGSQKRSASPVPGGWE